MKPWEALGTTESCATSSFEDKFLEPHFTFHIVHLVSSMSDPLVSAIVEETVEEATFPSFAAQLGAIAAHALGGRTNKFLKSLGMSKKTGRTIRIFSVEISPDLVDALRGSGDTAQICIQNGS